MPIFMRACQALLLALGGLLFSSARASDVAIHFAEVETPHGPLRLAVRELGRGRPILLLHGLATSSYTWRELMPVLAKNHRVIALDLRGFGSSDKPNDEFYAIKDQADVVEAFIAKEKLHDITLIGHSYGGGVSLTLALDYARQGSKTLKNLILIDTIAYRQPMPIFFNILMTPILGDLSLELVPPEVQAAQALRIAYNNKDKITEAAVAEYAKPLHEANAKHALVEAIGKMVPDNLDDIAKEYRTLRLPTEIIWCREDRVVPAFYGTRLKEDIASSELSILSPCGHLPQEEQPEETAAAITSFLSRHGG